MESNFKERAEEILLSTRQVYRLLGMSEEGKEVIIEAMCQLANEVFLQEQKKYEMLMKSNLHLREMNNALQEDDTKLAKERYKKAKEHMKGTYYYITYKKFINSALKIAAGLK